MNGGFSNIQQTTLPRTYVSPAPLLISNLPAKLLVGLTKAWELGKQAAMTAATPMSFIDLLYVECRVADEMGFDPTGAFAKRNLTSLVIVLALILHLRLQAKQKEREKEL